MIESLLTEDETIILLIQYLKSKAWVINSYCLGQQRGCDINAVKDQQQLLIEVKGARAGDNAKNRKREFFDANQIKTHFGKALVKVMEDKIIYPDAKFGIAHPDEIQIRLILQPLIKFLKPLSIMHFWVAKDGTVIID
ncbi:MAG: hypothetical protein EOO47_04970 [Flavobacterium sp.]|nr:MAG: hypothetical protein EOO47_04970 [Flavobacterium sp.]